MAKFREFEIKNFLGEVSSNRNPNKNECQICKNWDIREITGDLSSREGYRVKYIKPDYTDNPEFTGKPFDLSSVTELRTENFVVDIDGTETEVTLQFMKGTLTAVSGSGASPASITIGLFFIRPWYNGSSWTDNWLWLNECYLTTINTVSAASNDFRIDGDYPNSANYFKKFSIYNITLDIYSEIYNSTYVGAILGTTVYTAHDPATKKHDFVNGNSVLVMRNFIPYADLKEYYNVTAKEVTFYKIQNDLRIAFGGLVDRLPLMVAYRKASYQMDTTGLLGAEIQKIAEYKEIILAPYNSITENDKIAATWRAGSPSSAAAFQMHGRITSATSWIAYNWFARMTVLIDDYEEFIVPFHYLEYNAIYPAGNKRDYLATGVGAGTIDFTFRMYWGLFNKRITKVRLYLAQCSTSIFDPVNVNTPYFRVKEWDVSEPAFASGAYDLNTSGYLYNPTLYSFNETEWNNKGNELYSALNYRPSYTDLGGVLGELPGGDYVRGYDHAVVSNRRTFAINPYIKSERVLNVLFFSPFSGAGASLYDVLEGGDFINLDNNDGNNLKGLGVLPNDELAVFRENNIQPVRTSSAQTRNISFGYGLDTFRSMVNHGDRLTWCSQKDVFGTRGIREENFTKGKIRNLFRAISDKTLIFATKEENDNAYRFYDGVSTQYLLSERGWVRINTFLDPEDYMISKDGSVWFMNNGTIYNQTGFKDVDSTDTEKDIALQWKSIPFDIALIGEGIKNTDMFYVDSVWARYSITSSALTMKVYIDGSQFGSDITLPVTKGFVSEPLPMGGIGREIQIEITGTAQQAKYVYSLGFRWRPMPIGNRV